MPVNTSIHRFPINLAGRDWAVGDIHGQYTELRCGLKVIGFDPGVDRLFAVGDLVDRGPESAEALVWLDEPWFHAICGNHDFMAWRAALGHPYTEVEHQKHGGRWLSLLPKNEQCRIGERLRSLPLVLEVETLGGVVGLVHADCPFDDWTEMHKVPWGRPGIAEEELGEVCLWSVERHRRRYAAPIKNVRAVVHGHMTVPKAEVLGNVHFIDTAGWRPQGHFTFLELDALEPVQGPPIAQLAPSRKNR